MNQQKVFQKTTSQLYRDCLRLSNHIAGNVINLLISYFLFYLFHIYL